MHGDRKEIRPAAKLANNPTSSGITSSEPVYTFIFYYIFSMPSNVCQEPA
jgi:hypothetical protein